ncbi:TonB-dependent receptor [Gallaecimonas sp. GXIMD1310]|uniref:TonB-dependent receptor n=1 Tax=Gallaecimonas sp. GXIMD1310 TaxID=3131926 RepID=UPI00324B9C49
MMATFKPNVLSLALAAAGLTMVALPQSAFAADAKADQSMVAKADAKKAKKKKDDKDVEVIQVTGFRASLQRSQAIKQTSTSIVEAISAEDIGKLPDSSIADSIARLPGVAAQRLDGRASSITIRGLGENFSTTTLNGREQVSIGDNRGVEMDVYPAEIMNAVVVYKTPNASMFSQGIAGTVDLQTVRPLKQGKRSFTASLTGEKNQIGKLNPNGKDKGWRSTVSYIDQFQDDKVGVALAVSHMDSPNNEKRWQTWGYPTTGSNGDYILGGAKPFVRSSELKRDTVMGVLELAPNDKFHATFDGMHIHFNDHKLLRGIEIPFAWGQGTVTPLTVENGLVTSGQTVGQRVVVRNDFAYRKADLDAFGGNFEFYPNDNWKLVADASYSKVKRNIFSLESYSGTGRGDSNGAPDTLTYNLNGGSEGAVFTHTLDYSDPNLIQLGGPLSWGNGNTVPSDGQDGFINNPLVNDELKALKLTAERYLDNAMFSALEFGVHMSKRTKTRKDNGTYLTLNAYPNMLPVPQKYMLSPASLGFIGMGNMLSYDSEALYNDGYYKTTDEGLTATGRATGSWSVTEKVTNAYLMAKIDSNWWGMAVRGNVGGQYVHTNQSSDGYSVSTENGLTVITPSHGGTSYNDFLPSMNLNMDLTEAQHLRVGMARTLTRARMDRMNASFSYSFDPTKINNTEFWNSPWSAQGGNPSLKPYKANQFDLSYENYFSAQGYFSAALFYKDLLNWQLQVPRPYDFTGVQAPTSQTVATNMGTSKVWENTDGGYIKGAEFTLSLPFDLISDKLEGFGAILSATYTKSKLNFTYADGFDSNGDATYSTTKIDVPGLSRRIYNATIFYEKNGFQFRTSLRKRSDFLGEVADISNTSTPVTVFGNSIWDAQISYDFSESGIKSLKGFTVSLQGQNLSNEPFITSSSADKRLVRDYQVYGRNFLLGVSYKF